MQVPEVEDVVSDEERAWRERVVSLVISGTGVSDDLAFGFPCALPPGLPCRFASVSYRADYCVLSLHLETAGARERLLTLRELLRHAGFTLPIDEPTRIHAATSKPGITSSIRDRGAAERSSRRVVARRRQDVVAPRRPGVHRPRSRIAQARSRRALIPRPGGVEPQRSSRTSAATRSAMAGAAVRPGDSMPIRLMRPGAPCADASSMTKSRKGSPGPARRGRMPA